MSDLGEAFSRALALIVAADPALLEIVGLSLTVTLSAVFLAALLGLPLAAAIACFRFPGRGLLIATLNAFMGLPPVVVGLVVYLLLSRSGPLGTLGLLFTPSAMIIAQTILVLPIVTAVARQSLSDMESDYRELLRSLGAGPWRRVPTLLFETRLSLTTAVLAGFGRAAGEVGAVMIVGGNIDHVTRTMTTAIALETSKGHLAGALALGLILIALSATIALATQVLRDRAAQKGQVAER